METTNKFIFTILALIFVNLGFSQDKKDRSQPFEDVKVNKEFDKEGNLIRYDSTYVYSWSSDSSHRFLPDSAFLAHPEMGRIREHIRKHMHGFWRDDTIHGKQFRHPFGFEGFFQDHFFNSPFFDSGFFSGPPIDEGFFRDLDTMVEKHLRFRRGYLDRMDGHMDSLWQDFMEKQKDYLRKRDSLYHKQQSKQGDVVL